MSDEQQPTPAPSAAQEFSQNDDREDGDGRGAEERREEPGTRGDEPGDGDFHTRDSGERDYDDTQPDSFDTHDIDQPRVRTRRTDAVLRLNTAARRRLTEQLGGRLAHAQRPRGDG